MVGDVANVVLGLAVFLLSWSSAEVTGQLRLVRCARRSDQAGVTKRPINASLRAARLPNFLSNTTRPIFRSRKVATSLE
jgi:hypothetical protein